MRRFSGVDRAGDRYDDLAICEQTVALNLAGYLARIGELLLDLFVFWQSQYILTRANESYDHGPLQRRLAQGLDQNAIRCTVQALEVICDLRPTGDSPLVARREAENRFRRRDGGRLRTCKSGTEQDYCQAGNY
jgi:hypothetical protein